MLNLYDKEWKSFCIKDIFITEKKNGRLQVPTGSYIKKDKLVLGDIPRITVTSQNNGIYGFYNLNNNTKFFSNFISVSFLGNTFYHSYKTSLDMKVHCLKIKGRVINKYIAQFILVCLNMNFKHYSYGNQLSSTDLPNKRIMFPVDENGEPDYAFMEEFIKECEKSLLQKYRKYIENKNFFNCEVQPLSTLEWKEFRLLDYFDYQRGNQNNMNSLSKGEEMLISARNVNNGLKGFYTSKFVNKEIFSGNCITFNNDGDGGVGLAYYQPYQFLLDSHVYALYPKYEMNRYIMLFIARCLSKQRKCFSHGYSINKTRLNNVKIMLPVDEYGEPDFIFMENYAKNQEKLLLQKYLKYIEKRIEE